MTAARRVTLLLLVWLSLAGCDAQQMPLPPDALVDAFLTTSQAPDRSYQADIRLERRSGSPEMGDPGTITTGRLTVAGADHHLEMAQHVMWEGDAEAFRIEFLVVEGRSFRRVGSSAWTEWTQLDDPARIARPSLDPFSGLTRGDVEYIGVDGVPEERLHRLAAINGLAVGRRILGVPDDPEVLEGNDFLFPFGPDSTVEYYIDGRGVPVGAQVRMTHAPGSSADLASSAVRADFTVSNWGEPFELSPPIP